MQFGGDLLSQIRHIRYISHPRPEVEICGVSGVRVHRTDRVSRHGRRQPQRPHDPAGRGDDRAPRAGSAREPHRERRAQPRVRDARARDARPGARDGSAQPPLGRRSGAPDPAGPQRLPAAGVDRGRAWTGWRAGCHARADRSPSSGSTSGWTRSRRCSSGWSPIGRQAPAAPHAPPGSKQARPAKRPRRRLARRQARPSARPRGRLSVGVSCRPSARTAISPRRCSAASSAVGSIRRRSGSTRSETISRQPVASPRRAPSVNSVAASISTTDAPAAAHARSGARGAVVEEVAGHRDHLTGGRAEAGAQPRQQLRRAGDPPAGAERPAGPVGADRLAHRDDLGELRGPARSLPQVPTRSSVRAPSSASSEITIAALGPPMPVDWIVSGRPSTERAAAVPPQPAVVVEHPRLAQQRLGEAQRPAGVARAAAPARRAGRSDGCGSSRARRAAA